MLASIQCYSNYFPSVQMNPQQQISKPNQGSIGRRHIGKFGRTSALTRFVKIWDFQSQSFLSGEDSWMHRGCLLAGCRNNHTESLSHQEILQHCSILRVLRCAVIPQGSFDTARVPCGEGVSGWHEIPRHGSSSRNLGPSLDPCRSV